MTTVIFIFFVAVTLLIAGYAIEYRTMTVPGLAWLAFSLAMIVWAVWPT